MSLTNLDCLKKLSKKITGKISKASNTAEAIDEIAEAYSGGGSGGATVISANLYPDSSGAIKDGSITLSDGAVVDMELQFIPEFSITSTPGTASGTTKLTTTNVLADGDSYCYAQDRTPQKPAIGEDVSRFTSWDGVSDIEAGDGAVITLVECDSDKKAVKAGVVSAVIKY